MSIVTRFAPSPTGYLHLGHAAAAVNAWRRARSAGGRFLLRLEDIDLGRCRPEFAAAITEDLAWLGLNWDGPIRIQSAHLSAYQMVLDTLNDQNLLYPCFCTRADIVREVAASSAAPHAPDGTPLYPGTCRNLATTQRVEQIIAGHRFALRLDVQAALRQVDTVLDYHEEHEGRVICRPARFGDVVLARKNEPASYHLCATHDDALQEVTLVTRALDLKPATDVHRLLQAIMRWPAPTYAHHPLKLDAQGKRLAKRDKAATLRAMRDAGTSPEHIVACL